MNLNLIDKWRGLTDALGGIFRNKLALIMENIAGVMIEMSHRLFMKEIGKN